ncbi:MAG: hypothetical protein KAG94_01205 [Clostridiales bacterium]|nr:hypothetical protein [Clostridiales bacterium]
MYSIKDYQHTLNKTIDIKKALDLWQSYSDDMYTLYKPYLLNKKVLLIGAGHLTDFPMSKLLNQVSNITIYDIDKDAMSLGLKAQNINEDEITFLTGDITSLDNVNFFEQVVLLLQAKDLEGIKRFFRIISHMNLDLSINSKYDLLIISPFYTQLLLPQYLMYLNEFIIKPKHNEYLEPLLNLISKLINKINEQLINCINDYGKIIIMSDYLEFILDDPKYLEIKNNKLEIEKYYQKYLVKYGQGLGSYGQTNLTEKTKSINHSWHWWPFNEKKVLLVKLSILEKVKVEKDGI